MFSSCFGCGYGCGFFLQAKMQITKGMIPIRDSPNASATWTRYLVQRGRRAFVLAK